MTELFDGILACYGQKVTVTTAAGTFPTKAFLQQEAGSEKAVPLQVTPLGTADGRLWIYLGGIRVEPGDMVIFGTDRLTVKNSAAVRVGGEISHYWAVLSPCREAAE